MNEKVNNYYQEYDENSRLIRTRGTIEFERTKKIIQKSLNKDKMDVLDIGGATGHYSFWLADLGHKVTLVEPVLKHVEIAKKKNSDNKITIMKQSVENIEFPHNTFDLILNFGPLYHTIDKNNRISIIEKMKKILRPSGLVFISLISRFASLIDGYLKNFMLDIEYQNIVENDLKKGIHYPSKEGQYFTDSYFYHPYEIRNELYESGYKNVELFSLESFTWLLNNLEDILNDSNQKKVLYNFLDKIEQEESLLGISAHFLVKCGI